MLRTKKLIVWSLLAIPMFTLAGDLALAGKPSKPPLPNVRYRIKFVDLLDGAAMVRSCTVRGMNSFSQVVGHLDMLDGQQIAILFDPATNPNNLIDLNAIVDPVSTPIGFHLRSATDISNTMVVVGNLEDTLGNRQGFALDLAIQPPVLDLLPTNGSTDSTPRHINENGDILIAFTDSVGNWGSFLFHTDIYNGDPNERALRDVPYDFSDEVVSHLVLPLSGPHLEFSLSSPFGGRDVQVAGKTADGLAFRYTRDAVNAEVFSFPVVGVTDINDDGTFCGCAKIPLSKSRFATEAFVYTGSRQLLTGAITNEAYPTDMNSSKDLITRYQVYRNDWGWVSLNDVVVGTMLNYRVGMQRAICWGRS